MSSIDITTTSNSQRGWEVAEQWGQDDEDQSNDSFHFFFIVLPPSFCQSASGAFQLIDNPQPECDVDSPNDADQNGIDPAGQAAGRHFSSNPTLYFTRPKIMEHEMTVQEIEAQFDDEWVLIADPETDEHLQVLSGKVICHSKDRDEVYRHLLAVKPARYATLYTGEMPENTAVVL